MKTRIFGDIDDKYISLDEAEILLQPIPYDGTSTWGKGADKGFEVFINTTPNLEFYDIETDSEVYQKGIHILPAIDENRSPEQVYEAVYAKTKELLELNKFITFFGGEHSVSIGAIEAYREKYDNLTVLQLDAHSDLRPSYMGSEYNHACALHKASKTTNLVQVGIRSMDVIEKPFINKEKCFFAENIYGTEEWMDNCIELMTDDVYLTIDLDAFDPSIMPSTGTPEPGGLSWDTTMRFLKRVFEKKNIVGFDIVEFAPIDGLHAPDFLVAKLYYKLISYKFFAKK
ncbi:agmatinase [Carboxylicivirga mesophila]|uniref:Agmatinase n=1 Tax=Carboxylicivirga mesophila TaxID=1166478 RepID=A0ABS5KE56_9BACT|nr:agmatinase [Carboxylicivirga mesophila]MBS2213280.1 agmatinase [Carboxylicivirga mesophila]